MPQRIDNHGYSRYSNRSYPCRCEVCKEAKRAYAAAQRAERPALSADDPRHGTRTGYDNHMCRCEPCKSHHRSTQRDYYRRRSMIRGEA